MVLETSNREHHQSLVLQNVLKMRDKFCDVNLKIGEVLIPAHRLILSAACPFFENMFTSVFSDSKNSEVELSEMTVEHVEIILEYIYSGEFRCKNMDLLPDLYRSIDFLQMQPLQDLTYNLIVEHLTVESCLKTWGIFCQRKIKQEAVIDFIFSQLNEIVMNEDFLLLTFEKFQLLLRQLVENFNRIPGDKNSDRFYKAVMAWNSHDLKRKDSLFELLMILNTGEFSGKLIGKLRSEPMLQDNIKRMKWLNDVVFERYENILSDSHNQRIIIVAGNEMLEFKKKAQTNIVRTLHRDVQNLRNFSLVSSDNKIYVICGRYTSITNNAFSKICCTYDMEGDAWNNFEFPYVVSSAESCVVEQIIYIFGGIISDTSGYVRKVVKYDIETRRLTECSSLTYAAKHFSICRHGPLIFLTYLDAQHKLCISKYIVANDAWVPIKQENTRFDAQDNTFSTAYLKDKIYLLSSTEGLLFSFCLKTSSWAKLSEQILLIGKTSTLISTRDELYAIRCDEAFVYENGKFVLICNLFKSNVDFRCALVN